MGVVLPRPLAARPGRPLHPRRQLHRLLLVEDPRQGRDRRLGDPADRLPLQRAGRSRVRAARLPPRRLVQLVRLLAAAGALPVRARRAARPLPGGARADGRPRRGVGGDRRGSREGAQLQGAARQGRLRARLVGRGRRSDLGRARAHDPPLRARPGRGLLADPGDVDGLLFRRHAVPVADRRGLPELLRLVRRPAARLAAGLGRPDRRARVGRLVELRLRDALGLEHPADAHARCALHDRGALPGPEGRRRLARLRRPHEVRRPLAAGGGRLGRRARDGDGPRDPEGALRRAAGAVLRALRAREHRPAVPRHAARAGRRLGRRPLPARVRPRRDRRERRVEDGRPRREDRRARSPQRVDRLPLGRGGDGEVEPRARRGRARAHAHGRPRRARRGGAAAVRHRRLRERRLAPSRRPRKTDRRPPRHDRVRPARRPARRAPRRAARRLARGLRRSRSPTRLPGRRSTPASTRAA